MPPLQNRKRRRVACQHFPDDQTLRLQTGPGEDDIIHLPNGLDRVDCERREEEEEVVLCEPSSNNMQLLKHANVFDKNSTVQVLVFANVIILKNNTMITLRGANREFYYFLTAPRTVSSTYAQVVRAKSCAIHVQHIERLSRATYRVSRDTKGQLSYLVDRVLITFILALFYHLKLSTSEAIPTFTLFYLGILISKT